MRLQLSIRERVVTLVAGLGALGGFLAGATGALIAVLVLTPSSPVGPGDKVAMVLAYGTAVAVSGAVLGTALAFAILRRVRLGRVVAFGTLGATLGLAYGFLGGPWAWHHFGWLGVGGLAAGALVARILGRDTGEAAADGRLASWVMSRAGAPTMVATLRAGDAASLAGPRRPGSRRRSLSCARPRRGSPLALSGRARAARGLFRGPSSRGSPPAA